MSYKKIVLFLLVTCFYNGDVWARLRALTASRIKSGTSSQITVKSGSKLKNSSTTMNASRAMVNVRSGAILEGLPVGFVNGGVALNNGSPNTFTGSYEPTTGNIKVSNESYRALSGDIGAGVELSDGASMEGIPNINQTVKVSTGGTANISCQSTFNANFDLNGGNASLKNNMSFGDGAQLIGEGSIIGNGKSAILGGRDLIVTSSVKWVNADLVANSRLTLYGQWTFLSDIHVLGRGNILDLTHGGRLIIKDNTTVYLANINVKGLTPSNIIFEGANSKVVLSSASLGFDANITLTLGQVYIDSPSTFVVGNQIVEFAGSASLTINSETLFYDTLSSADQQNIKPIPADDPSQIYIKYLNGGIIRSYSSQSSGDINITTPTYLMSADFFLSNDRKLNISSSCELDGGGHFMQFAKDNADIFRISDGCNVVMTNVVLKDFNDISVLFGVGSSLTFGDGTSIELDDQQEVSWPWIFDGNAIVNGFGNLLDLGGQEIQIMQQGNLTLQDLTLNGLQDTNLRCVGNASITFRNDTLITTQEFFTGYTFTCGSLIFDQNVKLKGLFAYESNQVSTIKQNSRLTLDPLYPEFPFTAFIYSPYSSTSRDLIAMEDYTSELYLNGCILASSTTGMRLTKGTLIIDGKSYIWDTSAVGLSEGICFGNGISSDDLYVTLMPDASLEVAGILDIQNVN